MILPLILSSLCSLILAGQVVSFIGYYNVPMIFGTILTSIGVGLLTSFQVGTDHPMWIGVQVMIGFGVGFGSQQAFIGAQNILDRKDIPIGTAIIVFSQTLGSTMFVSIAQNVFTNRLEANLGNIPGFDPSVLLSSGATDLLTLVGAQDIDEVIYDYNKALTQMFCMSLALFSIAFIGAICMPWKSLKKDTVSEE